MTILARYDLPGCEPGHGVAIDTNSSVACGESRLSILLVSALVIASLAVGILDVLQFMFVKKTVSLSEGLFWIVIYAVGIALVARSYLTDDAGYFPYIAICVLLAWWMFGRHLKRKMSAEYERRRVGGGDELSAGARLMNWWYMHRRRH